MKRGLAISYLGTVGPEVHDRLIDRYGVLEGLHAQVLFDLTTLIDQGVDVAQWKSELDGLGLELAALRSLVDTVSESDLSAWHNEADALERGYESLLARTGRARQRAPELLQFSGLAWGIGALVVAGALAAFVWRGRRKRRRG